MFTRNIAYLATDVFPTKNILIRTTLNSIDREKSIPSLEIYTSTVVKWGCYIYGKAKDYLIRKSFFIEWYMIWCIEIVHFCSTNKLSILVFLLLTEICCSVFTSDMYTHFLLMASSCTRGGGRYTFQMTSAVQFVSEYKHAAVFFIPGRSVRLSSIIISTPIQLECKIFASVSLS